MNGVARYICAVQDNFLLGNAIVLVVEQPIVTEVQKHLARNAARGRNLCKIVLLGYRVGRQRDICNPAGIALGIRIRRRASRRSWHSLSIIGSSRLLRLHHGVFAGWQIIQAVAAIGTGSRRARCFGHTAHRARHRLPQFVQQLDRNTCNALVRAVEQSIVVLVREHLAGDA